MQRSAIFCFPVPQHKAAFFLDIPKRPCTLTYSLFYESFAFFLFYYRILFSEIWTVRLFDRDDKSDQAAVEMLVI